MGGYTITYLTCEILNAAQHETEMTAEAHADEQLKNLITNESQNFRCQKRKVLALILPINGPTSPRWGGGNRLDTTV